MKSYRVVFITVANKEEAKKVARALIEKKLAACVNILPDINSIYRWQGKIEESGEALLLVKTTAKLWTRLVKEVTTNHSYDTPEIISLTIKKGLKKYLSWIDESLR